MCRYRKMRYQFVVTVPYISCKNVNKIEKFRKTNRQPRLPLICILTLNFKRKSLEASRRLTLTVHDCIYYLSLSLVLCRVAESEKNNCDSIVEDNKDCL